MFDYSSTPNSDPPTQHGSVDEKPSLNQKGVFVAIGATSYVELLLDGTIIKTAWPGGDRAQQRRHEIAIEAEIYDILGEHHCLVKKKAWNPDEYTLTLEYMSNGTLKDYLESHANVPPEQRKTWVLEAVECIRFLHRSLVIHCDIGPHNFLLDDSLHLKIIDFSGSSVAGSYTDIRPGTRYAAPILDLDRSMQWTPTVKMDLFSLGSTIYYIMTGKAPFDEFESEDVQKMYRKEKFPDLTAIPHADLIRTCWSKDLESVDGLDPLLNV